MAIGDFAQRFQTAMQDPRTRIMLSNYAQALTDPRSGNLGRAAALGAQGAQQGLRQYKQEALQNKLNRLRTEQAERQLGLQEKFQKGRQSLIEEMKQDKGIAGALKNIPGAEVILREGSPSDIRQLSQTLFDAMQPGGQEYYGSQLIRDPETGETRVMQFGRQGQPRVVPTPKGFEPMASYDPRVKGQGELLKRMAKIQTEFDLQRQRLEGKGEITPEQKQASAQERMTNNLTELSKLYRELDDMGAIVNTERNAIDNILSRVGASFVGQETQRAVGTQAQRIRDQISNIRPLLIQDIRQATDMGARGLDSNRELDFYLQAATDPTRNIDANMAALQILNEAYGLGGDIQGADTEHARELQSEFEQQTGQQPTDVLDGGGQTRLDNPPEGSGLSQEDWGALTGDERQELMELF